MSLTPPQIAVLKQALFAETDPTFVSYRNSGAVGAMQDWYNAPGTFVAWRTLTHTSALMDAIVWANLTPTDAADLTQSWANRSLSCQGKQFNLQLMIGGRDSLPTGKVNIRNGLQDALSNVPSGASGALMSAGWTAVRTAMQQFASRAETLYATGTGTATTPGVLVLDGAIDTYDVIQAYTQ